RRDGRRLSDRRDPAAAQYSVLRRAYPYRYRSVTARGRRRGSSHATMGTMQRCKRWGTALLSSVLVLLAAPMPTAAAVPGPTAPEPAAPQVNWQSCELFYDDTDRIPTAQCTRLPVPVSYEQP